MAVLANVSKWRNDGTIPTSITNIVILAKQTSERVSKGKRGLPWVHWYTFSEERSDSSICRYEALYATMADFRLRAQI